MFHIRSSIYMHLFYLLMLISLSLIVVYECSYSRINKDLGKEAIIKEDITLVYLQNSIKKENSLLNSIYTNGIDNQFNKAAMSSINKL